jgi:hypothetical protein
VCFKKYGDKVYLIVNGIEVQFFNSKDPAAIPLGACDANYICELAEVDAAVETAEVDAAVETPLPNLISFIFVCYKRVRKRGSVGVCFVHAMGLYMVSASYHKCVRMGPSGWLLCVLSEKPQLTLIRGFLKTLPRVRRMPNVISFEAVMSACEKGTLGRSLCGR